MSFFELDSKVVLDDSIQQMQEDILEFGSIRCSLLFSIQLINVAFMKRTSQYCC